MTWSINILPLAEVDFREMYAFIAGYSPAGAERWKQAFEIALQRLKDNPLSCGLAPESRHFNFELRQLRFKTKHGRFYRAVYRIDKNVVIIYRLRGPGQAMLMRGELSPEIT